MITYTVLNSFGQYYEACRPRYQIDIEGGCN